MIRRLIKYPKRAIGTAAIPDPMLADLAEDLQKTVVQYDPVQIIKKIAMMTMIGGADTEAADDSPETFAIFAMNEYLAGLMLTAEPGKAGLDERAITEIMQRVAYAFDIAERQIRDESRPADGTEMSNLQRASMTFRIEDLLDRMPGHMVHLREIIEELYGPERQTYERQMGFSPIDVVRLVDQHLACTNARARELSAELKTLESKECSDSAIEAEKITRVYDLAESMCLWTPHLLAESTDLPEDTIASILDALSCQFGCQPSFRTPVQKNVLADYPLIQLSNDEYLAPVPWLIIYRVHDWLRNFLDDNPACGLKHRYETDRNLGSERLVQQCMERIFGSDSVHTNQFYELNGKWREIDCLVGLFTPLVIEVKSRSLAKMGDRHEPNNIKEVANEVVKKAFKQTKKARDYIIQSGELRFADKQGQVPVRILPAEIGDSVEIVVTLERMDPLTTAATKFSEESRTRMIWVTNLADFLMVADILDDPVSFLYYVLTRRLAVELDIQVFAESDALGAFLNDRMGTVITCASLEAPGGVAAQLGFYGSALNEYYIMSEVGIDVEKPHHGVPTSILESLENIEPKYSREWVDATISVMSAPLPFAGPSYGHLSDVDGRCEFTAKS